VSDDADPVLSALVVLVPRSGSSLDAPVHAGTIAGALPDPGTAARVREHFVREGFDVSEPAATGFSITGPRSLFLRRLGPSDAPDAALRGAHEDLELPLGRLPPPVAAAVRAVTFTALPDFGPGNP